MAKQKVRSAGRQAKEASLPLNMPMGKNYLLVIGIDEYDQHPPLFNAVADAKALAMLLEERYVFYEVKTLYNEDAHREKIIRTFEDYERKIKKEDNLLIYYSGHGYYRERSKIGYLIPQDAKLDTTSNYIENTSLLNLLRSIEAHHILIILDSCFSGSLVNSRDISLKAVAEAVEIIPSRYVMAAANLESASDGIAGFNSPFTKLLLELLKSNDCEKLPVSHLFQEVRKRLKDKGEKQTPIGGSIGGRLDFEHQGGEFVFYLRSPNTEAEDLALQLTLSTRSSIDQKIYELITEVDLFEKRGLYKQARASLARARKLAVKYHRYYLLIPIIKKQGSLLPLLEDLSLLEKIKKMYEDLLTVSEEIHNESIIYVFYHRLATFQRERQQHGDSGAWKQLLEEWTEFEKKYPQKDYKSFYSSYLTDCVRATIAFFQKEPEERFKHSTRVLEKWKANAHMIKEEPHVYKIHLSNHVSCCFQVQKWELFPDLIEALKALPSNNFNEEAETFQNYAFYDLLYLLNTLDFARAKASLKDITRGVEQYKDKINKARELSFYYNISILYFILKDFNNALLWLEKILNHIQTDHRKDLQRFAQILQLFYHYELGNISFLEDILHNVRRKLHRWSPLSEWEIFSFQLLESLMTAPSKKAAKEIFKTSLQHLKTNRYKASLGYDEIRIWLEKKIE